MNAAVGRHTCCLLLCLACLAPATAQGQDDDDIEYRPGLVARYGTREKFPGVTDFSRIDPDIAFDWSAASPDPRLRGEPFRALWSGRLFSITPGEYRLHLYTQGKVTLKLEGKTLLEVDSATPAWHAAQGISLEYGHHPLEIIYTQNQLAKNGAGGRLALFWEGPKFQLEPVPARHLFHDPKETPDNSYEQGQLLTRALRCNACHQSHGEPPPIPGPSLKHAGKLLEPEWIVDWLLAPAPAEPKQEITRRMPHFTLTREEAESLAAYLKSRAEAPRAVQVEPDPPAPAAKDGEKKGAKKEAAKPKPSVAAGAALVRATGCLACHTLSGAGASGLFGGGDLTAVGIKRPSSFFEDWLADPAALNPQHRMPVFRLSSVERASLAMFLAAQRGGKGEAPKQSNTKPEPTAEAVARGKELAVRFQCGQCHELPDKGAPSELRPLTDKSRWEAGCLGKPGVATDKSPRPGFGLMATQAKAVQTYLLAGKAVLDPRQRDLATEGRYVLAERNCLACHARDLAPGIAAGLPAVVAQDPELALIQPALLPPALNGVGDKLHEEWLLAAIESRQPLRPWLKIRMPRFQLQPEEKQALVAHFVTHDRISDRPAAPAPTVPSETLQVAGSRLVTADGFGCTSCHQVGSSVPHSVALNAHGTDLSLIAKRVRKPWYDRWVRDPARIVPRMEMPSVKLPVRGVLADDLDAQLAAVWQVVNTPGFEPPLPNPIRTVRASGIAAQKDRPQLVTDTFLAGKLTFIKPLVIGLPNRHNVLFDLDTGRMAGWWVGDTARERTRGKSWFWEPGGTHVWPLTAEGPPEITLTVGGQSQMPVRVAPGQFHCELDGFAIQDGTLTVDHRVQFTGSKPNEPTELAVTERWSGERYPGDAAPPFLRRSVQIRQLPAGSEIAFQPLPPGDYKLEDDGRTLVSYAGEKPRFWVKLRAPDKARFTLDGEHGSLRLPVVAKQAVDFELEYHTWLPMDRFEPVVIPPRKKEPIPLAVVPGYEAIELPLPENVMPTAIEFYPKRHFPGAPPDLVVASLKGEVWLAYDTTKDGLHDLYAPFSVDLAAPYGLAIPEQLTAEEQRPSQKHGAPLAIDVLHKHALLRLYDDDRDGHADRTRVLASGWGHTEDYHDWAVGLPRDAQGRYYVALPCEQDNRSLAAARYRGRLLRLSAPALNVAAGSAAKASRRWSIEEVASGLRFPMGLAMNRAGELFASDNQGNYNPFNELNHLEPGKFYGFVNSTEKKQAVPPLEEPAVNLPHPWTRSVNGICFLESPKGAAGGPQPASFGPFEGHLLGCEYDTQRLIRISLEKVDGVYQGAAYPFTRDPQKGERTLEGPVTAAVAPDGSVYIGSMRDSGWGAGANVGSIVRLRPKGPLPAGIAEVRAASDGFDVLFTAAVDKQLAAQTASYAVEAYRRVSTPAYGGPDADRHKVSVSAVRVSPDGKQVRLVLDDFQPGFVYELRVKNLAADGALFFPAEAHYTLRAKKAG